MAPATTIAATTNSIPPPLQEGQIRTPLSDDDEASGPFKQ